MRYLRIIAALLLLAGCAAREIKVDCDGKLQPINRAAQTSAPGKVAP